MVRPGDDLAALLIAACEQGALAPADGDVVVVAQKIVSKAEGRYVDLAQVRPSARAESLAAQVDKDPRLVEVILARIAARGAPPAGRADRRASARLHHGQCRRRSLQRRPRSRRGAGAAAAARSRTPRPRACATGSARTSAAGLAVIVTDSWGRAWRRGTVGVALGAAGLPALMDLRGRSRSVRARVARHRDRIRRRDRQRRIADHGTGGRGAAGGAGARPRPGRRGHAGRDR